MSQSLDDRVVYLLKQYIAGTCTLDEFNELLALISIQPNGSVLEGPLFEEVRNSRYNEAEEQVNWHQMLMTVLQQQEVAAPAPVRAMRVFSKIAIAATVVVCMGLIAWWWLQKKQAVQKGTQAAAIADIMPGRNGAILTLQNGQQLLLDSAANGSLATRPGLHIVKHDSLIAYTAAAAPVKETVSFNTLTTPRGRKFQLVLSDGTKVWLNAASSIRYPAVFNDKERMVDITGEAYFEVAKNAARPFIVNILSSREGGSKGRVEVLGTHFNINSYDDEEAVRTTLLEGKVKVENQSATGNRQLAILKPGEQVSISQSSQLSQPISVQTEAVMAWKNGYFQFERVDIQTVMRQIARWYDVDVQYEGTITNDKFGGSIPRDATLSQVLHALEQSLVHFTIREKKVIVSP
jgi:transmembrane sensor